MSSSAVMSLFASRETEPIEHHWYEPSCSLDLWLWLQETRLFRQTETCSSWPILSSRPSNSEACTMPSSGTAPPILHYSCHFIALFYSHFSVWKCSFIYTNTYPFEFHNFPQLVNGVPFLTNMEGYLRFEQILFLLIVFICAYNNCMCVAFFCAENYLWVESSVSVKAN